MALEVLDNALILYGQYDLSADHNEVKLDQSVDMLTATRFGHDTYINFAGLRKLEVDGKGFVQFDDSTTPKAVDFNLFNEIGAPEKVFQIAYDQADGSISYLGKAVADNYSPALKVGEIGNFSFKQRANLYTRGRVILPLAVRTVGGNSAIHQLGSLSSTQKAYVAINVTEFVGSDLDVTIFSNDTNDTVSPTSRATQLNIAAPGAFFLEISGPITDTYWYASWTFTGTNFKAAISAGIR